MKKVRYLIVSVSSAVLAFLSNLEPNQNKQWLMTLNDKKVEISIVCFACIVLLEFYEWCFAEGIGQKSFCGLLLRKNWEELNTIQE